VKTLLLIDANSIIHRSFHALPTLTTPDGKPIQAVYGLSSILLKLWREGKPDYAAALFDRPEPTYREKEFAEYKAQRPAAPSELISQIIEAHNLFPKFGVRTFEVPGYEADDLIATLAEKFRREPGLKVVILTGDLDTLQLVEGEKVIVQTFKKGVSDTAVYNEKAVFDRYGLKPGQLIDYKALVGDPSDNIKGVPGVGPKIASELLKKFGTLDEIYSNVPKDPKLEKKLALFRGDAELAKKLVTLERRAPVELNKIEELKVSESGDEIKSYFMDLGFKALLKRMEGGNSESAEQKQIQGRIFPAGGESQQATKFKDVVFIGDYFGATKYSRDFVSKKIKAGFGLKSHLKDLWKSGKDLAPPYFDLGVAFWLLDPDFKSYGPAAAFRKFLKSEWRGGEGDLLLAYEFCCAKLEQHKLMPVFHDIEMPLLRILAEMENFGIGVSTAKLKLLEDEILIKLEELTRSIYKLAGEEFNINSPQKVSGILFNRLKINGRLSPRTKTGLRSTRAESLEELKDTHPIVRLILDYREGFKILSTHVRPALKLIGRDGRLRTEFVQTGTATGRLSSQSPNLQNIPQESVWAEDLRSAFEAPAGWSFVAFDYSQLELRILAALSGDPGLIQAFKRGLDIHRLTASKVLGLPIEKIGESERRLAKTLNFGLIYGMGAGSFAKTSGISVGEAREFMAAYFKEFSRVRDWQEELLSKAQTFGYVETFAGRRRYLLGLASNSPRLAAEAERAALNFPIQGFGADLIKMSMIEARKLLEGEKHWGSRAKMILSIHDELLFEVRDDTINKITAPIKKIMEEVYPLRVPLSIDVSSGKDLGHLKGY